MLGACTPIDWEAMDREAWDAWAAEPIVLAGRVSAGGEPLPGATVTVADTSLQTDEDGRFRVELPRHNARVEVEAPGFHRAVRSAWLARVSEVDEVDLEIVLEPVEPGVVRLLFGGDVMFGRRFVDVDGLTPRGQPYPDRPDALIRASDPLPGAVDTLARIAPLLGAAEWSSVNFETPAVSEPNTPHPQKDFVFYSDPVTLEAIRGAGVDFVGLGNNHVYDYLEDGLGQTLDAVAGMPHAGAGFTEEDAWRPWVVDLRGERLAYLCATSIDGWRWDPAYSYVAEPTKGGAANLQDWDALHAAIGEAVRRGERPVVQVHTGVEYAAGPTERVRDHVGQALAAGAELVVGHHPHTAQGFSVIDGVLVAWSLGNLAFDGLRLETLLGAVLTVDLGERWERGFVHPVYLEDFRPRLFTGPAASRALRQMAEFSEGVALVEEAGAGRLVPLERTTVERWEVTVPVEVGADGVVVLDLRDRAEPGASVLRIEGDVPGARVSLGRDLMMGFGSFEDFDVDEDRFEVARWDHTGASVYPCREARSGVAALCSVRSHVDLEPSVAPFRNRIRVFGDAEGTPEKSLSLLGWSKADGAGAVAMRVEYHASFGETLFGEEVVGTLPGGSRPWTPFRFDFRVPDDISPVNDPAINPRAIRLFLEHHIPRVRGRGRVVFDDLAVVGWSENAASLPASWANLHPSDFVRLEAPPGTWTLTLTFGRPVLAVDGRARRSPPVTR